MQRRQAKADAAAEREQALVRAVTICQAIRRGNVWRKRVAYFEKWDKTSGEIEPMVNPAPCLGACGDRHSVALVCLVDTWLVTLTCLV